MEVVIDSNVLFRTLISKGNIVDVLFDENLIVYAPEKLMQEFLKHKSEIFEKSKLSNSEIEELSKNPNTSGTVRLIDYPVAKYRNRIGNYRILYDRNETEKVIEILDIRKRDESTYK